MEPESQSFLSQEIREFLAYNCIPSIKATPNAVTHTGSIDWMIVAQILDPEDFLFTISCCKKMLPKFHAVLHSIQASLQDFNRKNEMIDFQWTNRHAEEVTRIFKDRRLSRKNNLSHVLALTAILEHSLGNIYYSSSGKVPPHLLKDLLQLPELKTSLGKTAVFFMRFLMGYPGAFNLRNLSWHGFPTVEEIHDQFTDSLLALCITIQNLVNERGILIKYRDIETMSRNTIRLARQVLDKLHHHDFSKREFLKTIKESRFVSGPHAEIWKDIITHPGIPESFWLIFPQIEMILRRIYGFYNETEVAASMTEYYIVLDTVLEPTSHKENMSLGIRLIMYDLFIAERGPRLRDKVSHGEIIFNALEMQFIIEKLTILSWLILKDAIVVESKFESPYCSQFYSLSNLYQNHLQELSLEINKFNHKFSTFCENMDFETMPQIDVFNRHSQWEEKISKIFIKIIKNLRSGLNLIENNLDQQNEKDKNTKGLENLRRILPEIVQWIRRNARFIQEIISNAISFTSANSLLNNEFNLMKGHKGLLKLQKYTENFAKAAKANEWLKIQEIMSFETLPKLQLWLINAALLKK